MLFQILGQSYTNLDKCFSFFYLRNYNYNPILGLDLLYEVIVTCSFEDPTEFTAWQVKDVE